MKELAQMFTDELVDLLNGEFTNDAIEVMVAALVALECTSKEEVMDALTILEVE